MDFAKSGFLNRNHPIAASSYSSPALWTISPGASNDPEEKIDDRRIALNKITLNNDIMIDQLEKVQKYETGQNKISATMLKTLCDVFEVTPNYFYGSEETCKSNDNELPEYAKARKILADMPATELRGRAVDLLEAIGRTWKARI